MVVLPKKILLDVPCFIAIWCHPFCTAPIHLQTLRHLFDLNNQLLSTYIGSSSNKKHTSPVESNDWFFRHLLHLTRPPHPHRSRDPSVPPRLVATEPFVPWHWPHSCNSPHLLACHDTLACEMCWSVLQELGDAVFPAKYNIPWYIHIYVHVCICIYCICTLPETNMAPENRPPQ